MAASALSDAPIVPLGPAVAAAVAWRFRGEVRVTAVVKATFSFAGVGGTLTRAEPQPIASNDVHHGRNPTRSVRLPSDLAPYLRRADVVFTGSSYAPERMESWRVRFGISDGAKALFDKTLLIRKKGGATRVPVDYEHAFGGFGYDPNPYGEGFEDEESDDLNVLDPADPRRTAGFAPLSSSMAARKNLLGPLPLPAFGREVVSLPDGFDFTYFQAAPPDQRVDFLRGDEWILLGGLHPSHASLHMRLPGARGLARIYGLSGAGIADGKPLSMHADALAVLGDEERVTLSFRGSFSIADERALPSLLLAAGVETPGASIVWPSAEELAQAAHAAKAPSIQARDAGGSQATMAISDSDILEEEAPADATIALEALLSAKPAPAAAVGAKGALPFKPGLAHIDVRAASPQASAPKAQSGATLDAGDAGAPRAGSALPFEVQKLLQQATKPAPKAPSAQPASPKPLAPKDATLGVLPAAGPAQAAKPALPFKPGSARPEVALPSGTAASKAQSGATLPLTGALFKPALPFDDEEDEPGANAPPPPPAAPAVEAEEPLPAKVDVAPPEPQAAIEPPPKPAPKPVERVVHVETAPPKPEPKPEPPKKPPPPPKLNVKDLLYGGKKK